MPTLVPTSEENAIYELCLLYPDNLSQKEEAQLLKEVEGLFDEAGGKQMVKDLWGKRGLAYPIKKHAEGNFAVLYYEIDPQKIKEINHQLLILPNVLRHLIVKPPKNYEVVKYSEHYEKWLKERKTVSETKAKEEEKVLQQKVVERARRQAKRAEEVKKEEQAAKPAVQEAELTEKLEKLISDEDIGL
ncbi:MAG: 30S ribosomal protein S6 [Candidatus Peribacteraceae bacterium]|nr:30S ribosomal protein S6 [Candidatus Peribacteraceae bacterium]